MFDNAAFPALVAQYKADPESVYNTWFVQNDDRLKAFRSIRRGVADVVADIRSGRFPNDFKGSSLEFVLHAITEQKQVFEGAAHPFYWKPKLRIPDIYENDANKRAFGEFLATCLEASMTERRLLLALGELERHAIKGLGPAVANIVYFLHPTLAPPCNTAILRGFNLVFHEKLKLGAWRSWRELRITLLAANAALDSQLSKDLGAIAGLMFDVGAGKLVVDGNLDLVDAQQRKRRERVLRRRHQQVESERAQVSEHSQLQHVLLQIGAALGYDVWVASNDHSRKWEGTSLGSLSLPTLPRFGLDDAVHRTLALIDVLWLSKDGSQIVAAWEVEKSTSIYSGILRLQDLALSVPRGRQTDLYLVIPDAREKEVLAQLMRPAFADTAGRVSYILASELVANCDALCRFGDDRSIMRKLARCPCPAG